MQDFHPTIWVRPHSSSGSQKITAEDSNYPERHMLPMPNLWTNMCVENWTALPLPYASTLTTIRDPSCRRPSPTTTIFLLFFVEAPGQLLSLPPPSLNLALITTQAKSIITTTVLPHSELCTHYYSVSSALALITLHQPHKREEIKQSNNNNNNKTGARWA